MVSATPQVLYLVYDPAHPHPALWAGVMVGVGAAVLAVAWWWRDGHEGETPEQAAERLRRGRPTRRQAAQIALLAGGLLLAAACVSAALIQGRGVAPPDLDQAMAGEATLGDPLLTMVPSDSQQWVFQGPDGTRYTVRPPSPDTPVRHANRGRLMVELPIVSRADPAQG